MREVLNRNSELNNNKVIKFISSFLFIIITILILLALVAIFRNNLNLNNPLITESLKEELNASQYQILIINSIALIFVLTFKSLKQNMLAVIIGFGTIGFNLITFLN